MTCKVKKSGDGAVITVTGELTTGNIEKLRSLLIKALADTDVVGLDMENVTSVDLSCLQLLCSAHRSAVSKNRRLYLRHGRTDALLRAADAAGYSRRAGCRIDSEKTCLWRLLQEKGNNHD